jgi:hypothetical protein
MTTLVFVHGTGVRPTQYEETFTLIQQKLSIQRPDIKVIPCLWGEKFGTKLNAQGASIPLYDATLALSEEEEEDKEILLWEQLYRNPLYELQLLSLKPSDENTTNPFAEQPSDELDSQLQRFEPSPELQALLIEAGIALVFDEALQVVIRSEAYHEALQKASDSLSEYCDAIARARVHLTLANMSQKG